MGRVERLRPGQLRRGAFEINGISQRDRGDDQVQAAGSVALIFKGAVADLPEPVEEHGAPASSVLRPC